MKNQEKVINLLQIALKAGKVIIGTKEVKKVSRRFPSKALIIFSSDISKLSKESILKIINHNFKNIVTDFLPKKDLGAIFNRNEVGVIAILDKNFASGLKDLLYKK